MTKITKHPEISVPVRDGRLISSTGTPAPEWLLGEANLRVFFVLR